LNSLAQIDEPLDLEEVGKIIRVKGWAIKSDTETLGIYLDDILLGTVDPFIDRTDVSKGFPGISKPTGFDQVVSVPEVPDGRLHSLTIRSDDDHSSRTLSLRRVKYGDFDSLLRIAVIDMSRMCNFHCEMCPAHSSKANHRSGRLIADQSLINAVLPLLKNPRYRIRRIGASAIWGEPLMNPMYFQNTEKIASTCPEASVSLYTNGSFLTESNITRLLDLECTKSITVSFDAGTKENYERIRKGGRWETVIRNLSALIGERRRRGKKIPTISTNFVVMKDNFRELPVYVKRMADLGVDVIGAVNAHSLYSSDMDQGVFDMPWRTNDVAEERERVLQEVRAIELPPGVSLGFPSFVPTRKSAECSFEGASRVLVDIDGDVYPCCVIQSLNYEGHPDARPMGNILKENIESILASRQFTDFRLKMLQREAPTSICSRCPFFYGM